MVDVKSIARLPQIRDRFKRAMKVKIVSDSSGHGFQFRLPGFKYDDFDRAGFTNPVRINKMLESHRFINTDVFARETAAASTMWYLLGSHVTYYPTIYQSASITLPLIYDYRLIRIGKSSLDFLHQLFIDRSYDTVRDFRGGESGIRDQTEYVSPNVNDLVASRIIREVSVDVKSRKTSPVTKEKVEDLKRFLAPSDVELPSIDLPTDPPEKHFRYDIQVRYEDTDCFFHVNQGSYLEYTCEAAARASLAGAYPSFKGDTCFRNVRTATNVFSAEVFVTDTIAVFTWEDEKDPNTVYFVMRKEDIKGELVFRTKFFIIIGIKVKVKVVVSCESV